jgi:hypothetical protein
VNCGLQESHTYCGIADRFLTAANILPFIRVMDELLKDQPAGTATNPSKLLCACLPAFSPPENNLFSGHDSLHLNNSSSLLGALAEFRKAIVIVACPSVRPRTCRKTGIRSTFG